MKYIITIEKVAKEMVKKNEYVGKEDERANDHEYRNWEEEESIKTKIYEQSTENEINIKGIIDAFNTQPNNTILSGKAGGGGNQ